MIILYIIMSGRYAAGGSQLIHSFTADSFIGVPYTVRFCGAVGTLGHFSGSAPSRVQQPIIINIITAKITFVNDFNLELSKF